MHFLWPVEDWKVFNENSVSIFIQFAHLTLLVAFLVVAFSERGIVAISKFKKSKKNSFECVFSTFKMKRDWRVSSEEISAEHRYKFVKTLHKAL